MLGRRIEHYLATFAVEEEDTRLLSEVVTVELHRRIVADVLKPPDVPAGFPQHRCVPHCSLLEELLDCLKIVLRSDADHLDNIAVLSSKLLDV